jgi:hypothetical protein
MWSSSAPTAPFGAVHFPGEVWAPTEALRISVTSSANLGGCADLTGKYVAEMGLNLTRFLKKGLCWETRKTSVHVISVIRQFTPRAPNEKGPNGIIENGPAIVLSPGSLFELPAKLRRLHGCHTMRFAVFRSESGGTA